MYHVSDDFSWIFRIEAHKLSKMGNEASYKDDKEVGYRVLTVSSDGPAWKAGKWWKNEINCNFAYIIYSILS